MDSRSSQRHLGAICYGGRFRRAHTLNLCNLGICGQAAGMGVSEFLLPGPCAIVWICMFNDGSQRHPGTVFQGGAFRGVHILKLHHKCLYAGRWGGERPGFCCWGCAPLFGYKCAHQVLTEAPRSRLSGSGFRRPACSTAVSRGQQPGRGQLHFLLKEPCTLGSGCPSICRSAGRATGFWLVWLLGHRQCPRPVCVVVLMSSQRRPISPSRWFGLHVQVPQPGECPQWW